MKVEVGVYTGDHRQVNKVWTVKHTYNNVNLKEATSVTKPVIRFNVSAYNLIGCNYACIYWNNDTKKYYFMHEPVFEGQLAYVEMEEDVLQTFASGILNLECNVIRQEFKYNPRLPDDKIICDARRQWIPGYFALPGSATPATPFATDGTGTPVVLTVSGGDS